MKENICDVYFRSLACSVTDKGHPYKKYSKLLKTLHSIDFTYSVVLDGNRYDDGIQMRYSFGWDNNIPDAVIATCLDTRPCSVLEMMVALAQRCENEIMCDPEKGCRVGLWFWTMIESLGLSDMTCDNFCDSFVRERIGIFLDRNYKMDGKGGLFTINDCPHDLRIVEIWYQAMWYLNKYREE